MYIKKFNWEHLSLCEKFADQKAICQSSEIQWQCWEKDIGYQRESLVVADWEVLEFEAMTLVEILSYFLRVVVLNVKFSIEILVVAEKCFEGTEMMGALKTLDFVHLID